MALYWPVDAGVTQQFASNPNSIQPNGHTGMDFGIPVGTPVKAAGDGTVVFADWATTLSANNPWWIAPAYAGICVVIDHGNGLLTLYAHLNETSLNAGDRVSQGEVIGLSGTTGLSTGPHLHFEVIGWPLQPYNGFYGRVNPNGFVSAGSVSLAVTGSVTSSSSATLRTVGSDNVNQRSKPYTDIASTVVRVIPANSKEEFTEYVIGETVSGINTWFKDSEGFAWAGGFTSQSVNGMKDATTTGRRITGGNPAPYRKSPHLKAEILWNLNPNSPFDLNSYTYGDTFEGSDLWFGVEGQGWSHSKMFTDESQLGLFPVAAPPFAPPVAPTPPKPVVTPPVVVTPPAVVPPVVVTPPAVVPPVAPVGYSFNKDFDFVEYKPAHVSNVQRAVDNPSVVVFPPAPPYVVLHQFDAKEKQPSIAGVIGHFQTERPGSESSAHFAVSGTRIIQFVSLKDRAYHAGKIGNDYIGIEVDPQEDAATVASVKKLLTAIKAKYGYLPGYIRHRDVPGNSTLCGADIHLDIYKLDVPVTPPVTQPPVVVPPVVIPPVVTTPAKITPAQEREILEKFFKRQLDNYFS